MLSEQLKLPAPDIRVQVHWLSESVGKARGLTLRSFRLKHVDVSLASSGKLAPFYQEDIGKTWKKQWKLEKKNIVLHAGCPVSKPSRVLVSAACRI